jgi:Zn-dependent protease with chaperone function
MFKPLNRTLTSLLMAAALLSAAPLSVHAGAARPRQDEKEKKDKDKDKKKADDKPKLSKQERKYQEIKRFSVDKYNKDQEFRDQVDDAYTRLLRDHSDHAFDINTRDPNTQLKRDGDAVKILYALYDNPLAQDYVNRVGQSLIPANSSKLYAFKIILNPVPEARSLGTGTVYISTGLLSLVDNEAQLSYVLGHEIAHIEKDHWREDVLVAQGIEEYNEKQAKKRALIGAIVGVAAAGVAGASGASGRSAADIGFLAFALAPTVLKFAIPNTITSWDKLQEDEADQLGLQYMLDRSYDVREVPKFYAGLQRASQLDKRVTLGFMADAGRVGERIVNVNSLMAGMGASLNKGVNVGSVNLEERYGPGKAIDPGRDAGQRALAAANSINTGMAADVRAKLEAGELIGSTAEFETVMAELKRDNGVRALYYDMFRMARENLEESLAIRSNDPLAHFYYGKVLKLTAHKPAEKMRALAEFARAVELDKRRVLPEARLHRALAVIDSKDASQAGEIISNLKEYVTLYQRQHGGALPANMDVIYDYLQEAGDLTWSAPPAINVSTKNIEPVAVANAGGAPAPSVAPQNPVAAQPAAAGKKKN